ncbi:MAG: BACON domain-containing protein, partial [Alistipes sp.]|nr:BACON domain-containing protein [Alistipes sp.]
MANKLFKSIFAVAMVLGSALGFVACEEKGGEVVGNPTVSLSATTLNFAQEEGSQTVNVEANSEWKVENDTDWVTVTPEHGNKNGVITVAVSMNDSGEVRSATIKVIALHKEYGNWETKKLTVNQSADQNVTVEEKLLYSDNFDGKEATKTYGSGSSWPYIDQFPEFANPEGEAAANVTYTGSKVSVRANQSSNQSTYSNYAGSGVNNIFFGDGGYFIVNNIAPLSADVKNYKITFGVQKYAGNDGDSSFKNTDFLLYISKNGTAWAPVEYTYAGTEPGRWNVATANFTLNAEVEKLYIKFEAKVASVYRLDDLKLYVGNGGQTIDLDNIKEPEPTPPPTTDALYFENFDGKAAVKDGNYWPYVTDFPEMKNAAGAAAANVSYDGHNTTVRNNSNSDGTY